MKDVVSAGTEFKDSKEWVIFNLCNANVILLAGVAHITLSEAHHILFGEDFQCYLHMESELMEIRYYIAVSDLIGHVYLYI